MFRTIFAHSLLGLIFLGPLVGEVQLAKVFSAGTILQRGMAIRIWGTADVGETVTVEFAGQSREAKADPAGRWLAELESMAASAEGRSLIVRGTESDHPIELKDLLVGEVWLAGGQSNMAGKMGNYRKTTQMDIDEANDPLLRMVTIPRLDFEGQEIKQPPLWKESTPENVVGFSASAYYFAKNLREVLGVPVGIISCSVGGSPAEAWMSHEALSSKPDLKRIIDAYDGYVGRAYVDQADYLKKLAASKEAVNVHQLRRERGENAGPKPDEVMGPRHFKRPCGLYETMLRQVIPASIRGVIWYQGENNANAGTGKHYRSVFSSLIADWRDQFRDKDLPFLFVQLATLGRKEGPNWPELRDAQRFVEEAVANTGMVVMVDGGDIKDIHPHSKDKVGLRLSLLARNQVYGEGELVCRGPRLTGVTSEGSSLILDFKDIGGGLLLKESAESPFEICGADGNFGPAQATLEGGKLVLAAEGVVAPKHARYGWRIWFIPTLFNEEGLPAGPFRSDDLPQVSEGRFYLDHLK